MKLWWPISETYVTSHKKPFVPSVCGIRHIRNLDASPNVTSWHIKGIYNHMHNANLRVSSYILQASNETVSQPWGSGNGGSGLGGRGLYVACQTYKRSMEHPII